MDLILDWVITRTYTSIMRLTGNEISAIKDKTRKNFGSRAVVYLFGSRTDDSKKGGDIDLYIETEYSGVELMKRNLKFINDLQFAILMGEWIKIERIYFSAKEYYQKKFNSSKAE